MSVRDINIKEKIMATATMTNEVRKQKAFELYKSLRDLVIALYGRWQDEKDYEDINDYGVNIKKEVEAIGGEFVKMNKRPFGFTYKLSGATYQIEMTATQYGYKKL